MSFGKKSLTLSGKLLWKFVKSSEIDDVIFPPISFAYVGVENINKIKINEIIIPVLFITKLEDFLSR